MHSGDHLMLRSMRLLQPLRAPALNNLLAEATVHTFGPGSTLFEQGDDPQFVHFVLRGDIALVGRSHEHEAVIEFFHSGEAFLTPAVILRQPYLVSAHTVTESRIVQVPAQRFRRIVHTDHSLTLALNAELARYWRLLVVQIKDLKLRSTTQRLASYLLGQCRVGGHSMELKAERRALATRLGMTPESLSRAFRELSGMGVNARGKTISVADIDRLREFCHYDDLH